MAPAPIGVQHLRSLWPGLNASCPKWLEERLSGEVAVQGCITGLRFLDRDKTLLSLDDGFDVIVVCCKTSTMKYVPHVGELVRITGRCASFRGNLQLWGNDIHPADDLDELGWSLELDEYWRTAAIQRRAEVLAPILLEHHKKGDEKPFLELLCPCYCHCYTTPTACKSPKNIRWSPEFSRWVQVLKTVCRKMPDIQMPRDMDIKPIHLPAKCIWSCAASVAEAEVRAEADAAPFISFESKLAEYFDDATAENAD